MSKQREALKLALEVLEEINKLSIGENAICLPAEIDTAMDAIREALAEPEQEPVAWMMVNEEHGHKPTLHWKPHEDWHITWKAVPLYAAPPARKPLTDEEIDNLELPPNGCNMRELVRAIERAHGIGGTGQ